MGNEKCYFRAEYIADGYKTVVEKEYAETTNTQFGSLVQEIMMFLLACGFSESLINSHITSDPGYYVNKPE